MSLGGQLGAQFDDFGAQLIRQGRSANTVRAYRTGLRLLTRWLASQPGATRLTLTAPLLEAWQLDLVSGPLSQGTQMLAVNGVRAFVKWAEREQLVTAELHSVLYPIGKPQRLPRPLDRADQRLIAAFLRPRPPKRLNAHKRLRDRALWFFMLYSGARASEVCCLDRTDVGPGSAWVRQKGGSRKQLRFPLWVNDLINEYLEQRRDPCPALWVTHDTNRPTRRLAYGGLREIWPRLARQIGIAAFTAHRIRHTTATEMLDAGQDPAVVAAHLGHSDVRTLHNYARVSFRRRQLAQQTFEALIRKVIDQSASDGELARARARPAQVMENLIANAIADVGGQYRSPANLVPDDESPANPVPEALASLVEDYMLDCQARNLSAATLSRNYGFALRQIFLPFCQELGITEPAQVSDGFLYQLSARLNETGGRRGRLSPHSVRSYVAHINWFLRWARQGGTMGELRAQSPAGHAGGA